MPYARRVCCDSGCWQSYGYTRQMAGKTRCWRHMNGALGGGIHKMQRNPRGACVSRIMSCSSMIVQFFAVVRELHGGASCVGIAQPGQGFKSCSSIMEGPLPNYVAGNKQERPARAPCPCLCLYLCCDAFSGWGLQHVMNNSTAPICLSYANTHLPS